MSKNENKGPKKKSKKYILISIASVFLFLFIWWLYTDVFKAVPANALPSPIKVISTFFIKFVETKPEGATMLQHIFSSLQTTLTGYAIGVAVGVPLGICMGWFDKFDMFVRPIFDLLRPIPGIAWIPVMIVFFGIGLMSKAMVIFMTALIACVVNSYSGTKQTLNVHLWVGRTFGASNLEMLFRIAIPSAMPLILTGLRVALAASWSALVAAELLASNRGLGFMIQQCRVIGRPDVIIAGMITIGGVGALLTYLLKLLEKLLLKGRKNI
ncbi:MAG: ABC transporter permease [Eubacteriales bacterium]|nr:ABC transporter permease [Eubacteriales bacterium]